MKTQNFTSLKKTTFVFLLFALFGFYQTASAQLTVINNLSCWVLVGEEEGAFCTFCNNPTGTWLAPVGQPGSTAVFFPSLACATTGFQQNWIGIKYASCLFPSLVNCGFLGLGPGSFSENPGYPFGPCGYTSNNSTCSNNPVVPLWLPPAPGGAVTVILQ